MKIPSLALIAHKFKSTLIALGGLFPRADPAQQIRSGSVQEMIILQIAAYDEAIDDSQPRPWPFGHRDSNRSVQLHNRPLSRKKLSNACRFRRASLDLLMKRS